jgi:hypothetical protein
VRDLFSAKFKGGEGPFSRIAPFPFKEYGDDPTTFTVAIFAMTSDPQSKLKGAIFNTAFGT